jgi:FkbM family methyltransferase
MTAPFFPNQPQSTLELELRFRAEVGKLPEPSRLVLYEILSSCLLSFTPTAFRIEDGMVIAYQNAREIAFPSPIPLVKLSHVVFGYAEWLHRKYCLPGFVEVERGDLVVDCGAYVGGFSMSAAAVAAEVHAFEPASENFRCLLRNFRGVGNFTANQAGLYSQTRRMDLNISASSVEHSLLMPDDGRVIEVRKIDVITLRNYVAERKMPRLDFVKIEAEGVEPEVFSGLQDLRPYKLAIDVSPERDGKSPADDLSRKLAPLGYDIRQRGHVLFAKLRNRSRRS